MASADLLPVDVKEVGLLDEKDNRAQEENLPYSTSTVSGSDTLLDELSAIEALPHIPATEALTGNAISSPSRSMTEALPPCTVSSSEAVHNLVPSQLTASLLPQPMENLHAISPPPFLTKLYDMIEDPLTNSTVSWCTGNNSFMVWNLSEFSQCLLPRYFKHNNFSSFVRQLNTYGFKKINSDCYEFAHEAFLRGQKHLLKDIQRRKSALQTLQKSQPQQLQLSDNALVSPLPESSVQVGLDGEIEQLKLDKCALAAEVVRLRQLQESSRHESLALFKRVLVAEKKQEQMMNFLSKAIQSPAFLAKLAEQFERFRLDQEGRKRKHLFSSTEQSVLVQVGAGEPEVTIEIGKESGKKSLNVEEEMQGSSSSTEKAGVPDELQHAGRCDMNPLDMSPPYVMTLERKAREQNSTMLSAMPSHTMLATGSKTNASLDSAIIRRPNVTFKNVSDDLDLDFDLHTFIEEIILTTENRTHGNDDMSDAFQLNFISQPELSEALSASKVATVMDDRPLYIGQSEVSDAVSGSSVATAMDNEPLDRATSGRDP